MLIHLEISNYALIDQLDIDFHNGFTAITGETGAGKSILVDALDLVIGKRADSHFLLDPGRKCIVEAIFSITNYNLKFFFDEEGLDYDEQAILRREIHPNGKSRAFINDTPVTLSQLKVLGDRLVDIHSQHATTSLQDPDFHLTVIDSYAGLENELAGYREKYLALNSAKLTLINLSEREKKDRASLDYKVFLLGELKAAELNPDEQVQLEEKLGILSHAEEIKSTLYQVQGYLFDEEASALNLLSSALTNLGRVSAFHPGLSPLLDRLDSDLIDLNDICLEMTRLSESIEFSPEQLSVIQQRLELLYGLQHKHHVSSNLQLIGIAGQLEASVSEYSSLENQIKELENNIMSMDSELEAFALRISDARKAVFASLANEISSSLVHMGMPEARFEVRHMNLPVCGITGKDKIEFYFNANVGHSMKPLAEIASGGELSRVMLSIKSLISNRKLLPTIIFDEIDNGLSGDVAGRVGDVLVSTASRLQVIAVTHLPQIAGKARHHYSVYKHQKNNITFSNIKYLDPQERVAELAKMIGGREITEASLAAANELLTSTR